MKKLLQDKENYEDGVTELDWVRYKTRGPYKRELRHLLYYKT